MKANYLLQTADDPPAFIAAKTTGWLTGAKEVLEKLSDPQHADSINPNTYKYRINISLETGDDRYSFVNTVMWVGSGCRRDTERESYLPPLGSSKVLLLTFPMQLYLMRSALSNPNQRVFFFVGV